MLSKTRFRTIIVLFVLAAVSAASVYLFQNNSLAASFHGTIYTTTFDGQAVNQNTYASKSAVYLSGGPQNEDANGLADGIYYFQVTDPSGSTLLSTDNAECRQLVVAFGRVAAAEGPACQHPTGLPNSANGGTPVGLAPFDDTPNNGSEYKAWLIRKVASTTIAADGKTLIFSRNNAKTDNFKVVVAPCTECDPESLLSGKKFYDANYDGVFTDGEVPVQGVRIVIDISVGSADSTTVVTTDENGEWSLVVPTGATYRVGEFLPETGPDQPGASWVQSSPAPDGEGFQGYGGTANGDQANLNFGNVCFLPGSVASATPCSVSYDPSPTPEPTETPEPTPTPTPCEDECPTAVLSGSKFYDANANGVQDGSDVPLEGIQIVVLLTTPEGTVVTVATTDSSGNWSLTVPLGADYLMGEYLPDTDPDEEPGSYWEQTAPAANDEGFRGYSGTASGDQGGFVFGDICYVSDSEGNPVASATPCSVNYPVTETPTPEPTPDQ